MNTRRPGREDFGQSEDRLPESVTLAAGTLRADPPKTREHGHPDERLSLFWRVFGGTILSIVTLVSITLFNNLSSTITELRSEINKLNEARGEQVKKEEFNARTQSLWERVQTLQELKVTVSGLKEQVGSQNEKAADLKAVQEKLNQVEQRIRMAEEDHKQLAKLELTLSSVEQKSAVREAQLKAAEDDRKEMVKQLQELRERLAKVEGVTEIKPMPKSTGVTGKEK